MDLKKYAFTVLFLSFSVSWSLVSGEGTSEDCESLGFTGLAFCSDCDRLSEYVKDEELIRDCQKCCQMDGEELSKTVYSSAVLEVCPVKVTYYPNVETFINKLAKQYPSLRVRHRQYASPRLIMRDEDGADKESIRVDSWKTEDIDAFLKEKLKGSATV